MLESVTSDVYVGVDPGAKGAIAVLHDNRLHLFDYPCKLVKRGRSRKPITDIARLWNIVCVISEWRPRAVAVEKVWGVKGQGASAGAALGHVRGCLEVAFYAAGMSITLVSPQRWKADLGLYGQAKEASLQLAIDTFPEHRESFRPLRGVRDKEQCIGRAEAALIAWHAAGGRVR